MNKTLALHIEKDYLIAGTEPLKGKFLHLTKRGKPEFYFYFYIDEINNKIDYSIHYKEKALSQKLNYYGNFIEESTKANQTYKLHSYSYELIELLTVILDDIREIYIDMLKSVLPVEEISPGERINMVISFANDISGKEQDTMYKFIEKQNFHIIEKKQNTAVLLASQYIRKNNFDFINKKFAVLEATNSDLWISTVDFYTEFDFEQSSKERFIDFGNDPRTFILAKKIVDDINKQEGLLNDTESLNKEYKRHLFLAENLLEKIKNSTTPFLQLSTNFEIAKERNIIINISIEEINGLIFSHIRQISRYFNTHFIQKNNLNSNDFYKILLIGNTLSNDLVKNEFNRFGTSKTTYLNNNDLSLVLKEMLYQPAEKETSSQTEENWVEVDFLNITTLTPTQKVKLENFDATPAKGASMQKFSYLGNNKFIVLDSTRSLQKGEIAEANAEIWVPGMQIELKITSNQKIRGIFRTRKILKIQLSQ